MADDVTNIGDGWDIAVPGTAEADLKQLLAAGALTGQALCDKLIADGFAARGPAYYPVDNGKGPFYALGEPHTYVSIEQGPNGPQWNLTDSTAGVPLPVTGPTNAAPPPVVTPGLDQLTLADISQRLAEVQGALVSFNDLTASEARIVERINAAQEAIQQQIDQVVKNAEASAKQLIPIAEAVLPALSGLLGK